MSDKVSTDRLPTVVDLFAGCGGLSLGLEQAGFRPVYVNELGPDAMETYLVNRREKYPDLDTFRSNDIFELTGRDGSKGDLGRVKRQLEARYGRVDLVVGGPPCQGYSGIGHRRTFTGLAKEDIPSNHLYREMAKVIKSLRPRMFLFENVKGLQSARWRPGGAKGELWGDVQAEFASIRGYQTRWALVQAKDYGVPQNRPRLLLVGIHDDLLRGGFKFDASKRAGGLLPEPSGKAPDPVDLLSDLENPEYSSASLSMTEYPSDATTAVQERLRCDPRARRVARKGDRITDHEYSRHEPRIVAKFQYMLTHDGAIRDADRTKKFAQRVIPAHWGPTGPSITATSLADDYVHYSEPRVPTVREWARFQTFPDWYVFAGKRTTGGRRRAGNPDAGDWSRELPKYTQIGNAVPVWLAEAVGRHFLSLLR